MLLLFVLTYEYCMSFLTNDEYNMIVLFATVSDNKYRILKNGGVHAILQAMTTFIDDEYLQLNGLKLLCNIVESGWYSFISISDKYYTYIAKLNVILSILRLFFLSYVLFHSFLICFYFCI